MDEGQALDLFKAAADRKCLTASIERSMDSWWVQFVTFNGEKTIPMIDSDLERAIKGALVKLEEFQDV